VGVAESGVPLWGHIEGRFSYNNKLRNAVGGEVDRRGERQRERER
jgi:hypothetical protein